MSHAFLVCDNCENPFDTDFRIPLILHECGHTFCKDCVMRAFEQEPKQCPACDKRIREKTEKAFR